MAELTFARGRTVFSMREPMHSKPATRGELRASGYVSRRIKAELRDNLLHRLRSGAPAFPGIVGLNDGAARIETAVLPPDMVPSVSAARQDLLRRGPARRVAYRWPPQIHDDPYAPVCVRCRAPLRCEQPPIEGAPRGAPHRATLDTSVGDHRRRRSVKVAQGRTLGDPETVHYGLVPRTNRGVFGLNELPDLAERIQVALFNVLEERDIQVRGYSLRLPLDVFLIATANPEDYTNRGRIITPLKDRFGAEIRTHYLTEVADEVKLIRQEAALTAEVGDHLLEILARLVRSLRESSSVDQRSGVSARFAIAAAEGVAGSALRRAARTGDHEATVARTCDLAVVMPTLLGKIEFEMGEEGRERAVLEHLLRLATAATFRDRLSGLDLSGFTEVFAQGALVETGDLVPASDLLAQLGTVPGLFKVLNRLGYDDAAGRGQVAAAAEFTLEGLHLTRRIDKEIVNGRTIYGAA